MYLRNTVTVVVQMSSVLSYIKCISIFKEESKNFTKRLNL